MRDHSSAILVYSSAECLLHSSAHKVCKSTCQTVHAHEQPHLTIILCQLGSSKPSEQRAGQEVRAHVRGKGQLNLTMEAPSSSSHLHPSHPHGTGRSPSSSPMLGSGVTLCLVLPAPIPASHQRSEHGGYTARGGQKPALGLKISGLSFCISAKPPKAVDITALGDFAGIAP